MHAHCGSSLSLRSAHGHPHVSCARWVISSTSPFTLSPSSSSLLSSCSSCCFTPFTSLMSWITSPRTSAEERGTFAEKNSSTGYQPNDHFITERMSSTPRSPYPSNGSPKTSTTTTSPSVRRSSTRTEDEPITQKKKKTCRPVCRRRQ